MKYLNKADPQVATLLKAEQKRQATTLMMIPSENHSSRAVKKVVGSIFQDKYCEGYPYKRYYQGQENFDKLETLCQERAKKLFNVPHANVQPLSGSPANLIVYFALLNPGDTILSLEMAQGGHISHGLKIGISGKYYNSVFYHVDKKTGIIDYDEISRLLKEVKPKLLIVGFSAYPRIIDFAKISEIAKNSDTYILADIAHFAGLIAAKEYPSPVPYCHIITTTTQKTLRGPRGAIIMVTRKGLDKDMQLAQKIDRALFPGFQGGPHENSIAGIAVALKEASSLSFKIYIKKVLQNAKILADELIKRGFILCTNGTNTHLILIDLRNFKILGNTAAEALEQAGIIINRNLVPYDKNSPFYPSGIRLGTPGITSRGIGPTETRRIAKYISMIIKDVAKIKKQLKITSEQEKNKDVRKKIIQNCKIIKIIRKKVKQLCLLFPLKKEY